MLALVLSSKVTHMDLTQEEWKELIDLKNAINQYPASVHPDKMERFTQLFVRTIEGKGDLTPDIVHVKV